ncbi:hypothetical protein QE152_g25738 [Popillia japonica]|uniref:Uncharacterized protein n=1 Tax=Popillia japonica TaxID=7064 RepID=A0AAW1K159_POPJA
MSGTEENNRSNQKNPNHYAYWTSRGYTDRPKDWQTIAAGHTDSSNKYGSSTSSSSGNKYGGSGSSSSNKYGSSSSCFSDKYGSSSSSSSNKYGSNDKYSNSYAKK